MTSTRSPLTLLSDHLALFFRSDTGRHARARLSDAAFSNEPVLDLIVLLDQPHKGTGRTRRVQIVEALSMLAPGDEVAALCVMVWLRPELEVMARRSTRELVRSDEAEGDVIAVAWEVIVNGCAGRPGPLRHGELVDAIWSEVRRSVGLRRRQVDTVALDAALFDNHVDWVAPPVDPLERWPGLLATAVAREVLTPRQVLVIAQTRVEGRSLREVATVLGRTYDSLRMERARAETALRQFALSYVESEEQ